MITLTLVFETTDQAHHVLEAYAEAKGFGSSNVTTKMPDATVKVEAGNIPPYVPDAPVEDDDEVVEERDERGVPFNPTHHSASKKMSKGAWNRRKGHDRAAADAWEAQYLSVGNGSSAAPRATPPAATMANTAATVQAPPATMGPTVAEFQQLWSWCCANNKVTMADQTYIENTWGGHPMTTVFEDSFKRAMAFAYLQQKANA
jgi:hypothetical protein